MRTSIWLLYRALKW